jgi:hypothetical protein
LKPVSSTSFGASGPVIERIACASASPSIPAMFCSTRTTP